MQAWHTCNIFPSEQGAGTNNLAVAQIPLASLPSCHARARCYCVVQHRRAIRWDGLPVSTSAALLGSMAMRIAMAFFMSSPSMAAAAGGGNMACTTTWTAHHNTLTYKRHTQLLCMLYYCC